MIVDSVVFTLRGRPEEYSHALEGDFHDDVDFRLLGIRDVTALNFYLAGRLSGKRPHLPTPGLRDQIPAVSSVITEKVILAAGFIQNTLWHG